jgi:phenylacetate-CoA ligase
MNQSELIFKLSGYNISKAEEVLKAIQSDPRAVSERHELMKWEIFNHHLNHNEFYRSFTKGKTIHSWNDIPLMTKRAYQRPLAGMISKGFKKKQLYISSTSGSSGQPLVFAKDKFCHALAWALIKDRYNIYDIKLNSLQARFFGIPLSGTPALIESWKDKLMNRVRFPVFDLSEASLLGFVKTLGRSPFEYVYGYTNSIRQFCHFLLSRQISLKSVCPTLKCVIVTSEMCNDYDKTIISTAAGVPCVIEYGASETGILGFEFKDGLCRASDELMYLEVDEKGSLLITSLYNKAFPIIRYKIGDQVVLRRDTNSGVIIEKILGRSDDLIKLPNGKVTAGISIYYCSKYILEKMDGIQELYVTQTGMSDFKLFYIANTQLTGEQKMMIRKSFDTYLQPGLKIEFIKTESIRRNANGKLQIFHSELNDVL